MKTTYLAWNAQTILFFVKGQGFVGKACDASELDDVELALVKECYLNVRYAETPKK